MPILVFAESANHIFPKSTFEAVTYAAGIDSNVTAVVFGEIAEAERAKLALYGANKVISVACSLLDNSVVPTAHASALAQIATQEGAKIVVMSQSYNGRAIAPRLSVKLKAANAAGVMTRPVKEGSGYAFRRPAYSGKAFQDFVTTTDSVIITVKANVFQPEAKNATPTYATFAFEPSPRDMAVTTIETIKNSEKIALTEAEVVVSGGRGLKGPENWGMIEELAGLLDAATACSKPVADVHWRPHHEHVGQTGVQIAPNVYIAIGVSGAIQHLAGVNSSKTIIAINKDPEAPFFKAADYGIVGDAFEVVPQLIAEIKKVKGK